MEIDLFYELAVPRHAGRDEAAVYGETLAEIALADRLGFHGVWLVDVSCCANSSILASTRRPPSIEPPA